MRTATPPLCAVDAVVANVDTPCREHVRIELRLPTMPESSPGQFLQLRCAEGENTAPRGAEGAGWSDSGQSGPPTVGDPDFRGERPYLRRPFSIADRWDDPAGGTHLVVISHTVGPGTRWLAALARGDTLNLTGPLGRGFSIPATRRPILLVGGGVGIPPLLYMARVLRAMDWAEVKMILGARTRDLLCVPLLAEPAADGTPSRCVELPGSADYPTIVTSDDGTIGLPGQVTAALEHLRRQPFLQDLRPLVLACGPDAMLRSIAERTGVWGWDCQLCIEKNMSCGVGTCLSCVVRVADALRAEGWRWALSCTEGPVFDRDELVDYRADRH